MATIYIDDVPYEVADGQSLLKACLSLGFNIPYFCWHPAMHSVGSCRLCTVKQFRDEKDKKGFLNVSCMSPATDGTRISIDDPEAREFRAAVIEWLMLNHPHDCPVCDEGGECHLQDMTVMTGHTYRRYGFKKRTYRNQNLGPFINHEMNRCIQCYRCVRFYRDYADGTDFNVFGINNRIYFGRFQDGILENEFSGNLVEVCPTGVFTDKTQKKHFTRKWDLQTAPSICIHCGLGCNTIPGERSGTVRRIQNRYHHEINGYFLCDRGRFGYEFANGDRRVRRPLLRRPNESGSQLEPVTKSECLDYLGNLMRTSSRVIGIGSPRASLEANFSLRSLVGPENFYSGMSETDHQLVSAIVDILQRGPACTASLNDVEMSDAVLILGEDVTNFAPRLALSLRQSVRQKPIEKSDRLQCPRWLDSAVRQAVQNDKGPLFIAAPAASRLDDIATFAWHAAPADIARLGFEVARKISPHAPSVANLQPEIAALASDIADALKGARRPLIVSGTGCGSLSMIQAAANAAWALCSAGKDARLFYTVPECNSLGLGLMGSGSLKEAIGEILAARADTLIVLENDLYRREEEEKIRAALAACQHVVFIDQILHRSAMEAEVVLPAASFAETTGTVVNNEGRGQRFFRVFPAAEDVQQSWEWIYRIKDAAEGSTTQRSATLEEIVSAMADEIPAFELLRAVAPDESFRMVGQKIPRQPHRYSGRTALVANLTVHEPKPPDDADSALSFSMEGTQTIPPAALIPRFWAPGWNSGQALNKFQAEIDGPLRGGYPGINLIETSKAGQICHFQDVPDRFELRDGEWLILPAFHIFGSEELSALSEGIVQRIPEPYLALNPEDAAGLHAHDGDKLELVVQNEVRLFPVSIDRSLPRGVARIPVGLLGLEGIILPAWGTVNAEFKPALTQEETYRDSRK